MIEVMKKDPLVKRVIAEQRLLPGVRYKWSVFCYPFQKDGTEYLYNTLTKQCYLLEDTERGILEGAGYTAEEIGADSSLTRLTKDYFLVSEQEDEDVSYKNLVDLVSAMRQRKRKKGYSSYTILPTTACNARCFYCYEQGMKMVTMTPEIVERTISFILSTKREGSIRLSWFGGEPLVGSGIIDTICARLRAQGVEFHSSMISNGSLITDEIADKMANDWNLRNVQITLDGTETEYNKRKAYVSMKGSPYVIVMENIARLLRRGIKVNLRCNVDGDNLSNMNQLVEELATRFPDRSKLSVYVVPLFGVQTDADNLSVWKGCFALEEKLAAGGFSGSAAGDIHSLKTVYCMAQDPYRNVIIMPDGELHVCENCTPGNSVGTIFDGITNTALVAAYAAHPDVPQKCSGCPFLPSCTAFSLCPTQKENCRVYREHNLRKALFQALERKAK